MSNAATARGVGSNAIFPGDFVFGVIDNRPSCLLIGGPQPDPVIQAILDGASLRLAGCCALGDAGARLARTVAMDALLLDLADLTGDPALDALLGAVAGWPGLGDCRLVVLLGGAQVDRVFAALGDADPILLCDWRPAELALALCEIAGDRRRPARLHDVSRESDSARLEQLSAEVRRLAQTIDRLAQRGRRDDAPRLREIGDLQGDCAGDASLAADARPMPAYGRTASPVRRDEVQVLLQARRLRDRFLPADLFADPAWDMILDLMAARLAGKRVSVSSLCIAAAVPQTTALRWIGQLVRRGIFVRDNDPADARRVFISLSDEAADSLSSWFAAAGRAGVHFSS
jgi:hypothetical protein